MQSAGLEVMRSNQGVAVKKGMAVGRGEEKRGIRDHEAGMARTWGMTGQG